MKKILSILMSLTLAAGMLVLPVHAEQITITASPEIMVTRQLSTGVQTYKPDFESQSLTVEYGQIGTIKFKFDIDSIEEPERIRTALVTATVRRRDRPLDHVRSYLLPTIADSTDPALENVMGEDKIYSDYYDCPATNFAIFEIPNMDITEDLLKRIENNESQAAYLLVNGDNGDSASYDVAVGDRPVFSIVITYMNEEDLPVMEEKYVEKYVEYYLSETSAYAEYKQISEIGRTIVLENIYSQKSILDGVESFEDLLNSCIEDYFKSKDMLREDIDDMVAHFGAENLENIIVYNGLSEKGRDIVETAFLQADRSTAVSADTLDDLFENVIKQYYSSGDIDTADKQVSFIVSADTSIDGNNDVSLEKLMDGIEIKTTKGTPDLANIQISTQEGQVNTEIENGKLIITDITPETKYTLSWSELADGIFDSFITFTTTGVYVKIEAGLVRDNFKENETIAYEGTTAEFSSGRVNQINKELIEVKIDDENILKYDNGVFTGVKRGISAVTFTKNNEGDNPPVSAKRMMAVYLTGMSQTGLDEQTKSMETEFEADTVSTFFTVEESGSFDITAGQTKFSVEVSDSGEHQVFINQKDGKISLYVDGEKNQESSCTSKFNKVSIENDEGVVFSVFNMMDVYGTVCKAEWVTVRNMNNQIIGDYTYTDPDEDDKDGETGTVLKWYTVSSGVKTLIPGANDKTLTNASDYAGKSVVFEVTPANRHETGEAIASEPLDIPKSSSSNTSGNGSGSGSGSGNKGGSMTGGTGGTIISNYNTQYVPNSQISNQPIDNPQEEITFTDVDSSYWAAESIASLAKNGILNGYEDGSFNPSGNVTRAEFLCALLKTLKTETAAYNGMFSDVKDSDWFAGYVAAGVEKGLINGFDDGTFGPNEMITREQIAVIMANALDLTKSGELDFADNESISDWAKDAISKVCTSNIMQGKDNNNFDPKANATRAEMAAILYRAMQMR